MDNGIDTGIVWWQVYPLGFCGAPVRPTSEGERALTPRLDRLGAWLDYAVDMGVGGLMLNPLFASETHGYDTTDYFRIDPRLGDDASFDRLISGCHERGLRVMLDGVFNHVGRSHPLFQDALAGRGNEDLFSITRRPDGSADYATFEGFQELPALNHDSGRVADLVRDVMLHWMRRGVSAWRLDAAYAVPPAFWARVLPELRNTFPDAWFVGEVIHGDYARIVRQSGMDAVTQYELWKAVWSSLKDGNFFELDWCLKRHNGLMRTFVPLTFIGNHDVTRIASMVGSELAALGATILLTVGGVPSVYYGDEQALRGTKRKGLGGDDAVRPTFPAVPAWMTAEGERTYRLYHDLIDLRRKNPWLARATTRPTHLANRSYSYDSRGRGGEALQVDLRLDPTPHATISLGGKVVLEVGH